ncbi:MAG: hypothetical protein RIE58_06085 [Vicingaceae bacterium]
MKRFGYDYNPEAKMYFDSKKRDLQLPTWYPYVDFILLLDKLEENELEEDIEFQGENQLFLSKATDGDRYFLGTFNPVVRNLVGIVRSLLLT